MTGTETSAAADHEAYVKSDEIETTMKSQDLKYKSKEALPGRLYSDPDTLPAMYRNLTQINFPILAMRLDFYTGHRGPDPWI